MYSFIKNNVKFAIINVVYIRFGLKFGFHWDIFRKVMSIK